MRFLLLAALLLPLAGLAQTTTLYDDAREGTLNDRYALGYFTAPRGELLAQGSVFLVPSWLPGQLLLNGNSKPLQVPLKYDLYNLELRAQRPAGDSVTVPLLRVKEFRLADRRFACYPAHALPPEVGGGAGEIVFDSPAAQLLKFERKTLERRAATSGSYATAATVPVLEAATRYYLYRPADGRFTALKLRRASLEQALADYPAALQLLKTYKGSLTTEENVVAALKQLEPVLKN